MNYFRLLLAMALIVPLAILINQKEIKTKINSIDQKTIVSAAVADKTTAGPSDEEASADGDTVMAKKLINDISARLDLPVSDAQLHRASGSADKVAILIPQNHRYPGTDVMDKINDSAELTQNEIYQILEYLTDKYQVDFIMTEGDLYGQVPQEKIAALGEKIKLRDKLAAKIREFSESCSNQGDESEEQADFLSQADALLGKLNREIALAGAPYVLAVENGDISLVGAENSDTYEKCSELVRNYTYQKDQLATSQAGASQNLALAGGGLDTNGQLQRLAALVDSLHNLGSSASLPASLRSLLPEGLIGGSFSASLSRLENSPAVQNNEKAQEALDAIGETYDDIQGMEQEQAAATEKVDAPSRSDNPYSNISDPAKLENMIEDSEAAIQETVIDQRNQETAENFDRTLSERQTQVGVIQFGAGHEEGLVEELNDRNIDVVVVKPDEVARREQTDAEEEQIAAEEEQIAEAEEQGLAAVKKLIQNH